MSKSKQPPPAPIPIDQSSLAWKIFTAFVTDGQISVTEDDLRAYAIKDLKLSEEKMPNGLMEHLPVILVAFMNMWSGWHFKGEFLAGKFQKEHYFQRFQKFMMLKMNSTIRGQFTAAMKTLGEQSQVGNMVTNDGRGDPEFAPYAISINCPAQMLNTIVFSNVGDDVVMKQHLGSAWQDLSPAQLLNWPHIEVSFRTPDIYFVRRQATEYVRYLNFLPHESNKHNDFVIEHAATYGHQEYYSYDFLEKYMKVYLECLTKSDRLSPNELYEIQAILTQFLEDVKYIDVRKSMATNTGVLFRLAPVPFIRNKKLVKNPEQEGDATRVGYCEIITPKIQLLLLYFKPVQQDTSYLSFEYTEKLKNPAETSNIRPYISYKCTYCKVVCSGSNSKQAILTHLKNEHKMEQHVRCTLCKKQFDVLNLAACRWRHKCMSSTRAIVVRD